MANYINHTCVCESCGKMLEGVGATRRFCDDCRRQRKLAQSRQRAEYYRLRYQQQQRLERAAKPRSLNEVAREAAAAGMSYGKFVAMAAASERNKKGV